MIGNPTVPLHLTSLHQGAIFQAHTWNLQTMEAPKPLEHTKSGRFQTYCFHFFIQFSNLLIDTHQRVKQLGARGIASILLFFPFLSFLHPDISIFLNSNEYVFFCCCFIFFQMSSQKGLYEFVSYRQKFGCLLSRRCLFTKPCIWSILQLNSHNVILPLSQKKRKEISIFWPQFNT